MYAKTVFLAFAVASAAWLHGCISVNAPQPTWRESFVVGAVRPDDAPPAQSALAQTVLRIKRFRAAEPYDSRRMMVLDSKTRSIKPAEGGQFAVAPAAALTDLARAWLAASGGFADVVDPAAMPRGGHATLDAWIDQAGVVLDADGKPLFRLAVSFWLVPEGGGGASPGRARYDCVVTESVASEAPADIAAAAGRAVAEVLRQLEAGLLGF
ncbi:MAG: hypothetical protein ACOX9C_09465 [Kiritimatiellia bacterium]